METNEFQYQIGENTFTMRPLRAGQVHQLLALLKEVNLPSELNVLSLIAALGDKIAEAIAIILIDSRVPLKDKNVNKLAKEIEFEMDLDLELKIIEDFFVLTPVSSILEKMGKTVEKISQELMKKTGSTESPSSVPTET